MMDAKKYISYCQQRHKNKYDYSITNYEDVLTDVWVTCPKHGDFSVPPFQHLGGVGCPECDRKKSRIFKSFLFLYLSIVGTAIWFLVKNLLKY